MMLIIPLFMISRFIVALLLYEYDGSNCCGKLRIFASESFGLFRRSSMLYGMELFVVAFV